jgi:glycerol kinase
VVVDAAGTIIATSSVALAQSHPHPGWVEQDANVLLASVVSAVDTAVETATAGGFGRVVALGLSNQRESAIAWDRDTGEPVGPMLGWQDRRTAPEARRLSDAGYGDRVRAISGLPIDPMFSALKFAWLLDQVDPDRTRSAAGQIALGTVDSWLLFALTGEHRIEVGNASRTQLLDLATGDWSGELLDLFRVPRAALPHVVSSAAPSAPVAGITGPAADIRFHAVLGDSHAALYGHGVRTPGAVKVTYGTGSSIMGLLASDAVGARLGSGLVHTIAWGLDRPVHAFEGNVLSTGATVAWLAGVLGTTPGELMHRAETAGPNHGINLVPAFSGLGAPWWDENAEAVITGFTLGSTSGNLARAAAESIALQVEDVLDAADAVAGGMDGGRITRILADGGPSTNHWLMQLQADLSQRTVSASPVAELSALGVAHLAGLGVGLWTEADLSARSRVRRSGAAGRIEPQLDADSAHRRRASWLGAVARARTASPAPPSTPPLPSTPSTPDTPDTFLDPRPSRSNTTS